MLTRRTIIAGCAAITTTAFTVVPSSAGSRPAETTTTERAGLPDIRLSNTTRLASDLDNRQIQHLYTVATAYIRNAFAPLLSHVTIHIDKAPLQIDGKRPTDLLSNFNQQYPHRTAKYSHVLFSNPPETLLTEGEADTQENAKCSIRTADTNKAVITNAQTIPPLTDAPVENAVLIKLPNDSTQTDPHWIGKRQLSVMVHEIGHNLCLEHADGNAWYGTTAPACYHPIRDTDHIYISPMLGVYYFGDPQKIVLHKTLPEWTGDQYVYLGTVYPPSNQARIHAQSDH